MGKNTLSILVANQPGTLIKVVTVISGRGLNIHELSARVTSDPGTTRIWVSFLGEAEKLRLVRNQLEKLEVVREIKLISEDEEIFYLEG